MFLHLQYFFWYFYFYQKENSFNETDDKKPVSEIIKQLSEEKKSLEKSIPISDSAGVDKESQSVNHQVEKINQEIAALQKDSTKKDSILLANNNFTILGETGADIPKVTSIKQYDSLQNTLPKDKRDGFLKRRIKQQEIHLKEKYKNNYAAMGRAITERFLHTFPQMLFVSLPFFALILQLLYVRQKKLYYVNHVVFTIHLYCGTFILILLYLLIGSVLERFDLDKIIYSFVAYFMILFYWYKSFRNFYNQSRGKTILKFGVLFFLTSVSSSNKCNFSL